MIVRLVEQRRNQAAGLQLCMELQQMRFVTRFELNQGDGFAVRSNRAVFQASFQGRVVGLNQLLCQRDVLADNDVTIVLFGKRWLLNLELHGSAPFVVKLGGLCRDRTDDSGI